MLRVPCPEKVKLAAQYRIATEAYSYAVSELERSVHASNRAGFGDLIRLTLAARILSNKAREDFEKHVSEHGC